ncbi:MAG: hypothetical protein ACR2IM_06115 [Sediminibacterium sp.]
MKNRKLNILTALTLGLIITFAGCKKDDGGIRSSVVIKDVPVVSTSIESTGSQAIDLLNLAGFSGKFKVNLYFPGATPPDKVDIVVRKNGSNANVKVMKKDVTTLPISLTVTAADIAALFGTAIALGDTYDFAPDLYVGVNKYEAFPALGGAVGNGAGVVAYPLYSDYARFAAICAYNPAIYEGDFVVVSDAWDDYAPGDIITFTKIGNTQFSFLNRNAINPVPIIVNVNTLNNQVSITKQLIGSQWVYGSAYKDPFMSVAASTSSVVSPCSQTIKLDVVYGYVAGTWNGTYPLILKKK